MQGRMDPCFQVVYTKEIKNNNLLFGKPGWIVEFSVVSWQKWHRWGLLQDLTCFAFKDALLNTSTCCVRWLFDLLLPSLKQTDQSPVTHRLTHSLSASVCHTHTEMRTEGTGTAPLSCLLAYSTNPYPYKDIHKMLNLTLQSFHTAN